MPQLHKLLAVVSGLKGAANKIAQETLGVFRQKGHLFDGSLKTYAPDDDEGQTIPEDRAPLVTTVGEKLAHLAEISSPGLDAIFQVESTNQEARANIEVDGNVLVENAPVTFLLQLDKQLNALRSVYDTIPTRDPKYSWVDAPDQGAGISEGEHVEQTNRLLEKIVPLVLYEATDKHPAQVKEQKESVKVGVWTTKRWTGKLSPTQKYQVLKRIDALQRGVKQAMAKANETEHVTTKVAEALFGFINGDLPLSR